MFDAARQAERASGLLLAALREPARLGDLRAADWNLLLRVARHARLLGRLAEDVADAGLWSTVPERAARQLQSARTLVAHRQIRLTWEVDRVLWVLQDLDVPVIVLKGVAYMLAGLPAARGRLASDVDLMVPESDLAAVESQLLERGWIRGAIEYYDDRYYRRWMHEIPPLRHAERDTEIDVHHRILPRTSRFHFDPALLIARISRVPGGRAYRLAAEDMVLHALVHLLLEADPQEGLRFRDLVDVADLLRQFGKDPAFWDRLLVRAEQLGLGRLLYYGLRYTAALLGTQVPAAALQGVASQGPVLPLRWLMDRLIPLALLPEHPDHPRRRAAFSRLLLYMRAHWLRMPPILLFQHLGSKALRRIGVRSLSRPPIAVEERFQRR
ncbi:nucleotidyltransferase domain-containing protein [Thiorhodococcus drewsii]|uniref:nucleotidyltransferase domain-containing protein n=1 Tax=Thiorhodococcus drewsii TaxID=210408 RepID=UPI001FDEF53E|nr:nucleotidyltransferase family protein [Thiorhodococcus drewsii]